MIRPFLRSSNVWRLVGLVLIVAGKLAPSSLLIAGPLQGEAFTICGGLLIMGPMLRELFRRFRPMPPGGV